MGSTHDIKVNVTQTKIDQKENNILVRYSELQKLIRIMAYCHRFIAKCRRQEIEKDINITTKEIKNALEKIITLTQKDSFAEEIHQLMHKKQLDTKSRLLSLNPFIDTAGIMRVGGRLQNSNLSFDEKHPIIMPHDHHITNLIIREAHAATLHGENENTLAFIRRKYWIINARSKVRQKINKCVKCWRFKGQTVIQQMGIQGKGSILKFVTLSKFNSIIEKASNKLPPHFQIIPHVHPNVDITITAEGILVRSLLILAESELYEVVKVTPIPIKIKENVYAAPDIPSMLLASNYNLQYF